MNPLLSIIVIPFLAGVLTLIIPKKARFSHGIIAVLALAWMIALTVPLLTVEKRSFQWSLANIKVDDLSFNMAVELVSSKIYSFILLFVGIFGFLIALYSITFMKDHPQQGKFFGFLLWTAACSAGVVLSDNLFFLLVCWEFVTLMLFLLVNLGGEGTERNAMKSFIMLGASDACMLMGIGLMWIVSGTLTMSEIHISLSSPITYAAFLLMMIAALTKAGAMPFHTWIPSIAETSPTPVMALLPASLDKLLGIYLLARLCIDLFAIDFSMKLLLMIIGAFTVLAAVMMAMVQHNLMKLLSYHAVSQVGYMVLGIGTGTPIGIAGGIFHMLNNAIYKSCLFLTGGSVKYRTKRTELERLGGLGGSMPLTFFACVISALAISGVPPLNGFVSKWMVYQGTLDVGGGIIFLIAAMFGSALTLASFIKVLYSVFLGQKPEDIGDVKEVNPTMTIPMVILALLCLFFGIVAQIPLMYLIGPIMGLKVATVPQALSFIKGIWSPTLATILILIGIVLGVILYLISRIQIRRADVFVGGERFPSEEIMRFPGTDFYNTIRDLNVIRTIYGDADQGVFDPYVWGGKYGGKIVELFRAAHTGVLPLYLAWFIIGLGMLLLVLIL